MQDNISFTKMHAIGNDFVVLDRIRQYFKITPQLIQNISHRHLGIGCDQVLLLDPPTDPSCDFEYRIFNQDGSEVEQCGNGARCVGRYIFEKGLSHKKEILLHTQSGITLVNVKNLNHIQVNLGPAVSSSHQIQPEHSDVTKLEENRYQLKLEPFAREFSFISLGNPHCIFFVPSLNEPTLEEIAVTCQQHEKVFPESVNVIFVQVLATNHIRCRVFERNCGETQACGSGACAAVIAGIQKSELTHRVQVDLPGGSLEVKLENEHVILSGPTCAVFEGHFLNESS